MVRKAIAPDGDAVKFCFLMPQAERDMLEQLATAEDRSAANWLRLAIRAAHAEKFGTGPSKKTKR